MQVPTSQEVEVEVVGVITRLIPCASCADDATGGSTLDNGEWQAIGEDVPAGRRIVRNPNGYRHDCAACKATPTMQETLERVVTRSGY
jgi:hypothetical protein